MAPTGQQMASGTMRDKTLRFAEELVLLLIRDDGKFDARRRWSLDHALAGSVLMDLALEHRIDTDLERLMLMDATPIGDELLDGTLAEIVDQDEQRDARHWVQLIASHADAIRDTALARLCERGVLDRQERRVLGLLRSERYPVVDGKFTRSLKERITNVLFSTDVPSPHDIVLIGLADACHVLRHLLSCSELDEMSTRIKQVRDLDLVGRAVFQAIYNLGMHMTKTCNVHYPHPCPE